MILGIDASNIRGGGGVTHLSEVLRFALPNDFGFQKVIVWSNSKTHAKLCDQSWLEKVHVPILDGLLPQRIWWQQFMLPKLLKQNRCDLLYSPGGTLPQHISVPTVTMSQNMLPFDKPAIATYPKAFLHKKLHLIALRILQARSFRKAGGLIFLTNFVKDEVLRQVPKKNGKVTIIPHGANPVFFHKPRSVHPIESYSFDNPFRFLYVSMVHVYKHQWHVVEAVGLLRHKGYPVAIDFAGPQYLGMDRFQHAIDKWDPKSEFIKYHGVVPYEELSKTYVNADAFIFASSCENMPNILLEAMASGLPIACSNRGPMSEVLGEAGVYFDPERPEEIADVLAIMLNDHTLREGLAQGAYDRASEYSWERCARETFSFLAQIAGGN